MGTIDFTKITACGECCFGCKKKDEGLCEGCIESDGRCKEWAQSGECPVHRCAKNHGVQFCGLCAEFPCEDLPKKIHWNPNVVEHLHEPYDEILKDADVLSHCFYNPDFPVSDWESGRYTNLLVELGCSPAV